METSKKNIGHLGEAICGALASLSILLHLTGIDFGLYLPVLSLVLAVSILTSMVTSLRQFAALTIIFAVTLVAVFSGKIHDSVLLFVLLSVNGTIVAGRVWAINYFLMTSVAIAAVTALFLIASSPLDFGRAIALKAGCLVCQDTISGSFNEACLRWRLPHGEWRLAGTIVSNGPYSIAIEIDGEPIRPTLGTTVESRYYQQKREIPEVSVKVSHPGELVTKVTF